MIPLAEIERDGRNHRLDGPALRSAVKERAQSMRRLGQLSPIDACDRGDDRPPGMLRYVLAAGFIRCSAAELLGWTEIRAEVSAVPADPSLIEQHRAAENLDRLNLNPMEEAVAVGNMLEACGGDVGVAAARLGKPESWVRDRGYLNRLFPEVRKWLMDGTLPLKFAREVAKLGDHDDQVDIAERARTSEDGRNEVDLRAVQQMVAARMRSLKIVPWPLDVSEWPKGKKIVGACVGCAFNTSTDRLLFEHDAKAPEDGLCLRGDCFEAKQQACQAAVEKAVKQIVGKKLPATESSARELAEEYVKPATVARAAKKAIEVDKPGGGGAKKSGRSNEESYEQQVRNGERKYHDALRKWVHEQAARIMTAARERAGGIVSLSLCSLTPSNDWYAGDKELQKSKPMLDILFADDVIGPALAKFSNLCVISGAEVELDGLRNSENPLLQYIASKWKLALDPTPEKAEFMPKKPGEKPPAGKDAAAASGKKPKASSKAKRRAAPVAEEDDGGGDDDDEGDGAVRAGEKAKAPAEVERYIQSLAGVSRAFAWRAWNWLTVKGAAEPVEGKLDALTRQLILDALEKIADEGAIALLDVEDRTWPEEEQSAGPVDWVARIEACATAEAARELFCEHEKAIESLHRSMGLKPIVGKVDASTYVGFGTIDKKRWASAIAVAKKKDAEKGAELQRLVGEGWKIHGKPWEKLHAAEVKKSSAPSSCRVCGCTDDDCSACIKRTGEACSWMEPDLCSACYPVVNFNWDEASQAQLEEYISELGEVIDVAVGTLRATAIRQRQKANKLLVGMPSGKVWPPVPGVDAAIAEILKDAGMEASAPYLAGHGIISLETLDTFLREHELASVPTVNDPARARKIIEATARYRMRAAAAKVRGPAEAAGTFDDDGKIDQATFEMLVDKPGLLKIAVARRGNGQWGYCYEAKFGKFTCSAFGKEFAINGGCPSRVAAAVKAADCVDGYVMDILRKKKVPKRTGGEATRIRLLLNELDKSLAAESPDAAAIVAGSSRAFEADSAQGQKGAAA